MSEPIQQEITFNASPKRVYEALLDARQFSQLSGGAPAEIVADAYGGLRFLPQSFFIGRDGNIVKQTFGVRGKEDFENDIRQALGTAQPPT